MKRLTEIWITHKFAGFHSWPEAPEEVRFLARTHRHFFHVKVGIVVTNPDRQYEFFLEQQELWHTLLQQYNYDGAGLYFDNASCEMIAARLLDSHDYYSYVEVSEDGENGAIVYREVPE